MLDYNDSMPVSFQMKIYILSCRMLSYYDVWINTHRLKR